MSAQSSVEEYYEIVKDQYDIDLNHFKLICTAPFKLLKEVMSKGFLKNIRFQYFGTFEVSKGRVEFYSKNLKKAYEQGYLTKEKYEEKLKMYQDYGIQ